MISDIYYDPAEVIQTVESMLDELKPFRYDAYFRNILGDGLADCISRWDANIRARKEDPFTVVVCGEFKRGKSTIINALLGEDVAPTNVTTETVTVNRICYGLHSNEAVLSGGRRVSLPDEDLKRFSLEKIQKNLQQPLRQLILRRPVELLRSVTILDTPGLNDADTDFSELVEETLQQADAVIYASSVSYPLSRSEQVFLKSVVIPQKYTRLYLLANFSDILESEQDYDSIREEMERRVHGLLPDEKVWMVSALSQRCAQKGWESPNTVLSERLANDFRSFQEDFERLIENRAKLVIPDRMFRMLRMMMSSVTHEIYAVCQGLDMSLQDAEEAMERVQEQKERKATELVGITEKLSRIISHDSTEAEIWLSQLLQNMEQETNTLSACSTEQITKYYTFYCMDTLQKAITKCLDYHMDGIFNHLNEIGSGLAQSVMGTEYAESYSFQFHLDNKTWTKGDNIGFMVSFLGIGGVMNLVANAIGGTMRKQELQSRKMELVNAIRAQYPSLRKSVMECIQNSYQQIQKKITVQLAEYYAEELETVERLTEQAISVARQNEERKEEIRQAMRKLQDVMDKIRAFVTIREE